MMGQCYFIKPFIIYYKPGMKNTLEIYLYFLNLMGQHYLKYAYDDFELFVLVEYKPVAIVQVDSVYNIENRTKIIIHKDNHA